MKELIELINAYASTGIDERTDEMVSGLVDAATITGEDHEGLIAELAQATQTIEALNKKIVEMAATNASLASKGNDTPEETEEPEADNLIDEVFTSEDD